MSTPTDFPGLNKIVIIITNQRTYKIPFFKFVKSFVERKQYFFLKEAGLYKIMGQFTPGDKIENYILNSILY
ncbi:MAG: hypothetical protein CVT49_13115 [candidate division Zixibacteria bacterium HGW-Zixibacteria-1]|nr:MAG: hypothetical protein CVT49_13115 [candidate division Zixibacteria bacterium HGW-Zixibacteria-1]